MCPISVNTTAGLHSPVSIELMAGVLINGHEPHALPEPPAALVITMAFSGDPRVIRPAFFAQPELTIGAWIPRVRLLPSSFSACARPEHTSSGLGVHTMRERAAELGGCDIPPSAVRGSAIRSVANGEAIFGARIATGLKRFLAAPASAGADTRSPQLTDREVEILDLLAQRQTNAQIAAALYLSQKTVRNYVSAIFASSRSPTELRRD
jgi:DNA-binding CsgD family transcriptional regulator